MRRYTILIGVLVLASCSREKQHKPDTASGSVATPAPAPVSPADTVPPKTLSGTRWRLVEFQSMDDKQGIMRPEDPSKYTMSFDSEGGFVVMHLDCHMAKGSYEDTRSADKQSGSFTPGTMNVTRGQCPNAAMAERIIRDMPHIRSYRFANGRLAMALMADGGIYFWERVPTS